MPVWKRTDRDVWVLDYVDARGKRHREFARVESKREAERQLAGRINQSAEPALAPESANATLSECAEAWVKHVSTQLKPRTVKSYLQLLKLYILPTLGNMKLREIQRGHVKAVLARARDGGLSKNTGRLSKKTVRLIRACLSAMLAEAVDDGPIKANPAAFASRRGRARADSITVSDRQRALRPFSEAELMTFLTQAASDEYHALFLTLARTGMRPGEAMGLKWSDLDLSNREIIVERALSDGIIGSTKTGTIRRVDMSLELRDALSAVYVQRERETLRRGWSELPDWVFVNSRGKLLDDSRLRKRFASVLRKASLSGHTPYDLRHTFATLLLAKGVPITYVTAQLGRAKPTTILQHYAHWLPGMRRITSIRWIAAPTVLAPVWRQITI